MIQFKNFKAASRKPNLIPFGMFPRGANLAWLANYATLPPLETPDGDLDGVNDTFTVNGQFFEAWVFLNGQMLTQGVDYTFNGDTGTITFLAGSIPQPTDVLRVAAFANADADGFTPTTTSAAPTVEVPVGAIDGSNTAFALSKTPEALQVYLNGVRLTAGIGYVQAGASFVTQSGYTPQTGDSLIAVFW